MSKLYEDTVLNLGPGAQFIKRPKHAAIVAAFEGGATVADGLARANEALSELLTSARYKENPIGYLRSYLPSLVTAEALEVTDPGTAPVSAAADEDGEKPKRKRKTKAEKAAEAEASEAEASDASEE